MPIFIWVKLEFSVIYNRVFKSFLLGIHVTEYYLTLQFKNNLKFVLAIIVSHKWMIFNRFLISTKDLLNCVFLPYELGKTQIHCLFEATMYPLMIKGTLALCSLRSFKYLCRSGADKEGI